MSEDGPLIAVGDCPSCRGEIKERFAPATLAPFYHPRRHAEDCRLVVRVSPTGDTAEVYEAPNPTRFEDVMKPRLEDHLTEIRRTVLLECLEGAA